MVHLKVGDIVVATVDTNMIKLGQKCVVKGFKHNWMIVSPLTGDHKDIRVYTWAILFVKEQGGEQCAN